ncbi:MAG TPA: sigma-54-dependent Fis family transcriptional regulator [Deltaproteobacteria bacterium]|nr:sigma-54-dependent Fis family transcriptional regulator [Deltaproteobacteria bacterium]
MPRVLVVEDDDAMRSLILDELTERGYTVTSVADSASAEAQLEEKRTDVLVTDLNLVRSTGLVLCRRALVLDPDLPVILITAFGTLETAIEAIRAGAYDFLTKPFSMDALALAVDRAAKLKALKDEVASLRVDIRRSQHRSRLDGVSAEITRLRQTIATVAATDVTVLITGESGSGKELVARELHDLSRRSSGPFVAENVAAIPAMLLESTLFGHVRGAFTGAASAREGLFRSAHGGTLLLDEVGELPSELQPKLLRVLESGVVRPVGSDRVYPVDVRLLAATHRDLAEWVQLDRFREDLYYRLAVVELTIPSLRARGGDILLLAQLFLEQQAKTLQRDVRGFHHEAAARLLGWHWPGNVRELRNVVERAVILTQHQQIRVSDLPERMRGLAPPRPQARAAEPLLSLAEIERRHVLRVLQQVGGNKAEAARILGIGRKTLYRKIEGWGLAVGQGDTPRGS